MEFFLQMFYTDRQSLEAMPNVFSFFAIPIVKNQGLIFLLYNQYNRDYAQIVLIFSGLNG